MSKYNNSNHGNGGPGSRENGNAKDSLFDMDSAVYTSDQFRMHEFKVKRCPRARPHDWTQCPFAHPGEKARRRDPRRYKYSGTACPEFRKSGCCRRGDACPFAHGVFECWLHPSRYRTQLCTDGPSCRRRVCFFAHVETELRHPEDDPAMAQKQHQAELAVEVQTLQQQHLTQALQALIAQSTNPVPSPDTQSNHGQVLANDLLKQNPTTLPIGVGSNNGFSDSGDHGNSTSALQAALLQHLQQNGGDKSTNGGQVQSAASEGTNSSDLHTAGAPLTDVYSALNQLQHLMLDPLTTGIPSSTPPSNGSNDVAPTSLNPAAILSQMMAGNGNPSTIPTSVGELSNNSLMLSSLLNQQNAAKMSITNGNIPPVRRSIDNSYFNFLNSDTNAAMAAAAITAQFGSAGFPAALQNGGLMPNAQELNVPTSMNTTVPLSGPSIPADSMYSVENIQLLLQNPAFSSNLSQLFQMNPGLVEQLTSTANEDSNHTRHSIDNAYLSQLNTDINHFVNNGGVKNGSGSEVVTQVMTPAQQEAMMMNSDLFSQPNGTHHHHHHGYANGLSVSEALIQGLNALKLQIEGNPAPPLPPLTVQAPAPPIENGQGSASHLSVQSSSNHSSSESAFQASSDTSGNDGNCEIANSSNSAAADPQLESLE